MTNDNRTSRQQGGTRRIGFLLLNNFTLISLSSAIEPLRMANQLSGKELYDWFTISESGEPTTASDGLKITPDLSIGDSFEIDTVIVVGGVNITRSYTPKQLKWLQTLDRRGIQLGAVCTGAYVLAAAGLLDGQECSAHWECLASLHEAFPKVASTNRLFSISSSRLTSSGGIVPLDMMLSLIRQQHGNELSTAISEMFICDRIRTEQDHQRVPLRHTLGTTQPKLIELVALMESNLEEPINLDELASYVGLSRRQLERLFQKHLGCSPSRYYLKLRLTRARQLLRQTSLSIIEVASACGFVSTPHFSKCYRAYLGIPPRDERRGLKGSVGCDPQPLLPQSLLARSAMDGALKPVSVAALSEAKFEPSYGSVAVAGGAC
ncbi:choline metabolism transcriptional regulator GbdR [Marinobacterium arenosum]|uniref:choline metabolism transcriptional regulator GbdR n=1 Tax=Marinobacterium arenosum TaxID=2862496 RepID=UPI001C960DA8|nr:GlxA family transcriptional regulator [Marinobacterium arenosum]MBY4678376.1 GlxA family transcriptional regulator [Marinobacterium arenosum]